MDKFLGLPVDGVLVFVVSLVAVLVAFWISEVRSVAKVVKASKSQVKMFKEIHKSK